MTVADREFVYLMTGEDSDESEEESAEAKWPEKIGEDESQVQDDFGLIADKN